MRGGSCELAPCESHTCTCPPQLVRLAEEEAAEADRAEAARIAAIQARRGAAAARIKGLATIQEGVPEAPPPPAAASPAVSETPEVVVPEPATDAASSTVDAASQREEVTEEVAENDSKDVEDGTEATEASDAAAPEVEEAGDGTQLDLSVEAVTAAGAAAAGSARSRKKAYMPPRSDAEAYAAFVEAQLAEQDELFDPASVTRSVAIYSRTRRRRKSGSVENATVVDSTVLVDRDPAAGADGNDDAGSTGAAAAEDADDAMTTGVEVGNDLASVAADWAGDDIAVALGTAPATGAGTGAAGAQRGSRTLLPGGRVMAVRHAPTVAVPMRADTLISSVATAIDNVLRPSQECAHCDKCSHECIHPGNSVLLYTNGMHLRFHAWPRAGFK